MRAWVRFLVPFLLVAYAVIALSRYDWVHPFARRWEPELFPIAPMSMFSRVPDLPPFRERLARIRRGEL